MFPETGDDRLDGGRAFNGGNPPAELRFGDDSIPNPQKDAPPQTILGAEQKAWFKDQLRGRRRRGRSGATRWARSTGAPIRRIFPPA